MRRYAPGVAACAATDVSERHDIYTDAVSAMPNGCLCRPILIVNNLVMHVDN